LGVRYQFTINIKRYAAFAICSRFGNRITNEFPNFRKRKWPPLAPIGRGCVGTRPPKWPPPPIPPRTFNAKIFPHELEHG